MSFGLIPLAPGVPKLPKAPVPRLSGVGRENSWCHVLAECTESGETGRAEVDWRWEGMSIACGCAPCRGGEAELTLLRF